MDHPTDIEILYYILQGSLTTIEELAKGHALDADRSSEVNLLLFLQLLMMQERIIVQLSACDFTNAARGIQEAIETVQRYPHMFERYRFNVHVLVALYAIAVEEWQRAMEHLDLVVNQAPTYEIKRWAKMLQVAAETTQLLKEQSKGVTHPEALRKKKERLFAELDNLANSNRENGHAISRAVVSFLRGILCDTNHASKDAVRHLTDSMALCTDGIKNTQLLAQVSLELGKIYLREDNAEFVGFINDALERSSADPKSGRSDDFIIRIPALGLALHDECDNNNNNDVDAFRKALQSDVKEMGERRRLARQKSSHESVLGWINGKNQTYDKMLR